MGASGDATVPSRTNHLLRATTRDKGKSETALQKRQALVSLPASSSNSVGYSNVVLCDVCTQVRFCALRDQLGCHSKILSEDVQEPPG